MKGIPLGIPVIPKLDLGGLLTFPAWPGGGVCSGLVEVRKPVRAGYLGFCSTASGGVGSLWPFVDVVVSPFPFPVPLPFPLPFPFPLEPLLIPTLPLGPVTRLCPCPCPCPCPFILSFPHNSAPNPATGNGACGCGCIVEVPSLLLLPLSNKAEEVGTVRPSRRGSLNTAGPYPG
jgi:hypothetical protein